MVNQQLLDYIKQQSQQGVSNDEIKKQLLANGWQSTDVEEVFGTPQTSVQPKKRRWRKVVLITIGVIVLLIIALLSLPGFLKLIAKHIAPIDDSNLSLKVVTVSNNDNAYFDLIKIKLEGAIYDLEEKSQIIFSMATGKIWDDKVAEEIVSQNAQAFGYFAEAASKPKFQDPTFADPANFTPNAGLPKIIIWDQMAHLSAIKALYLAKQGKDKDAMDESLNSVSIGQKIQESQTNLIEYIVGMLMKEIGLETTQKILTSSKLSSIDLKQYAQGLSKYYKNEDGLIKLFKAEYQMQSWSVDAVASGNPEMLELFVGEEGRRNPDIINKIKDDYYFQPNKTKLLFADYARANIKSANEPCGEIKETEIPRLTQTNHVKLYTEENAIGNIIHDILATSLTKVSTKKCEEDLLVSATQAQVAIKAYKNDTNNYPSSLNDLIPAYLSSVPQDSFDGKSLKYSAGKRILYSVGKDIQDSGGSTGNNWREMSDPTFKINF